MTQCALSTSGVNLERRTAIIQSIRIGHLGCKDLDYVRRAFIALLEPHCLCRALQVFVVCLKVIYTDVISTLDMQCICSAQQIFVAFLAPFALQYHVSLRNYRLSQGISCFQDPNSIVHNQIV